MNGYQTIGLTTIIILFVAIDTTNISEEKKNYYKSVHNQ
jgi:hypothetical protein